MTSALRRRLVTVPATFAVAVLSVVLAPLWVPVTAVVDLARGRRRLPLTRLGWFGIRWSWLECAGVLVAAGLWVTGRRNDRAAHLRLQRWWVGRVVAAIQSSTGLRIDRPDTSAFSEGPLVMLCRHASLADSVVSAWVVTVVAGRDPRYVLKRELLNDPCLDIVGNRLPNHFLDRQATDSGPELAALRDLSDSMGPRDVAIIFPEGTRSAPHKRERMLESVRARDANRADRLGGLGHLLPPRPAGAAALLDGCPEADVLIAWHVGFEGMDTFGGIIRRIAQKAPAARFEIRRVPRAEVPAGEAFTDWLDAQWLVMDRQVDEALAARAMPGRKRAAPHGKEDS